MVIILIYLVLITAAILMSALYSAAETALTSISQPTLHKLKSEGNAKAILICELREQKELLLGALLIASTAFDTLASALAISLAIEIGGIFWVPIATVIIAVLIILFGDIIPKTYAFEFPTKTSFRIASFIRCSVKILFPLTKAVQFIVRRVFLLLQIKPHASQDGLKGPDLIRGTIEMGHSLGYLLKDDKQMLDGILDLNSRSVGEIMTHYDDVFSYDINTQPQKLLKDMLKTGHSRFPVWEKGKDNIIGVLFLKDLFHLTRIKDENKITKKNLVDVMVKPWFVPESNLLDDQLREFRRKKLHFSIVVDEYGAIKGVVSLEDILEEVVGNIDDEHDESSKDIRKIARKWYVIRGNTPIRDVNRKLDWELPSDEATTIAGILMYEAGKIPDIGDEFEFYNTKFIIEKKRKNQLTEIKARKLGATA